MRNLCVGVVSPAWRAVLCFKQILGGDACIADDECFFLFYTGGGETSTRGTMVIIAPTDEKLQVPTFTLTVVRRDLWRKGSIFAGHLVVLWVEVV
jgi:hypothetical protein